MSFLWESYYSGYDLHIVYPVLDSQKKIYFYGKYPGLINLNYYGRELSSLLFSYILSLIQFAAFNWLIIFYSNLNKNQALFKLRDIGGTDWFNVLEYW